MVTIVIPLYNKEQSIRNTILSVLAQSYVDFELLVVDDGSTDNSAAVVRKMAENDNRIRLIQQSNSV